ncbi:MAG: hypothetical protein JRI94_17325 [Deltaproteobacteria bacterium]|nr:hypothetical protein [Deltaproteobacteria bacterium]
MPIVDVYLRQIHVQRTNSIAAVRLVNVPGKESGNSKNWPTIRIIRPTKKTLKKPGSKTILTTGGDIGISILNMWNVIACCKNTEIESVVFGILQRWTR